MPSQESYRDALLRVIDEVVAPGAAEVDMSGKFPTTQVEALGAAGLLGLTVPANTAAAARGCARRRTWSASSARSARPPR